MIELKLHTRNTLAWSASESSAAWTCCFEETSISICLPIISTHEVASRWAIYWHAVLTATWMLDPQAWIIVFECTANTASVVICTLYCHRCHKLGHDCKSNRYHNPSRLGSRMWDQGLRARAPQSQWRRWGRKSAKWTWSSFLFHCNVLNIENNLFYSAWTATVFMSEKFGSKLNRNRVCRAVDEYNVISELLSTLW